MKFFVVALALFALVAADVSELPSSEYLPPVSAEVEADPAHTFGPDGYSYKVPEALRRRYRFRVRRDVSELGIPSNEYLPPVDLPVQEYIPPVQAEAEPAHTFGPDGYSYKNPVEARRRYRIRRRRDVSELAFPSNEYLPPVDAPVQEYIPPVQAEAEPAHTFGPDGYSYKNPVEARRRYRIRRRRDVSELAFPSSEYLPPVSQEYLPPVQAEAEPAHTFGPEGYTYKDPVEARRRYRIRRRRDVSELAFPSSEYLPPVSQEYLPPVQAEAEPAHTFGPDGYTYKDPVEARRRYRIRRRRDVSELAFPSNEYLPPVDAPVQEYIPPVQAEAEPAHTFGPDGYSYKNPVEARRRYRIRRRRDVSELAFPSSEYLPPVSQEYLPPVQAEAEPAHTFGPDGYSYKEPVEARRRYRIRYRH